MEDSKLAQFNTNPQPGPPPSAGMARRDLCRRCGQVLGVWAALAAGAVLLLLVGYSCPLQQVLGFPCPSCGITRGAVSLILLEPTIAWRHNPLIFLLLGEGLILSLGWIWAKITPLWWKLAVGIYGGAALARWIWVYFL